MKFSILLLTLFFSYSMNAQDLVYKPKWLLSSAESQNKLKDTGIETDQETELERFINNLNSQLLNQVSRSLFAEQFGNDGISEGTYTFGSLSIDVYPSEGGLTISILDTTTGEQTQVIIPNP